MIDIVCKITNGKSTENQWKIRGDQLSMNRPTESKDSFSASILMSLIVVLLYFLSNNMIVMCCGRQFY
jgi:hypothetical protein